MVLSIRLEPVVLLYYMATSSIFGPTQELYIEKACKVNLNYSEALCNNIKNYSEVNVETQKLVANAQVNTNNERSSLTANVGVCRPFFLSTYYSHQA